MAVLLSSSGHHQNELRCNSIDFPPRPHTQFFRSYFRCTLGFAWYCRDMRVWNVGLMCICSPTDNKATLCSACPPPQRDRLWKALIKTAPAERTPNMVFLVASFEQYNSGTEKLFFRLNLRDNRPPQPSGRSSLAPSLSRSQQVWFGLEFAWPFFFALIFWFVICSFDLRYYPISLMGFKQFCLVARQMFFPLTSRETLSSCCRQLVDRLSAVSAKTPPDSLTSCRRNFERTICKSERKGSSSPNCLL